MDEITQLMRGSALGYAAAGWKVFPLRLEDAKRPKENCPRCRKGGPYFKAHSIPDCSCIALGKTCHGAYAATTDPERITQWWDAPYGVAVSCGPSGLIVLDCDDHGGRTPKKPVPSRKEPLPLEPRTGMDVMMMLAAEHTRESIFSSTATTVTPGGGRQVLFTAPDAMDFSSDSNGAFAWQVDVRAGITQTTLAPTIRPDGAYRWLESGVPVAPLPDWIRAMLVDSGMHRPTEEANRPVREPGAGPARHYDRAAVQRAFERQLNAVRGCTGGVTWQLSKSAFTLGMFVARGEATYDDTFRMLFSAARQTVRRNNSEERDKTKIREFDEFKVRATIEHAMEEGAERVEKELDETQVTASGS